MLLTSRFDDALALACELHREQLRKGSDVPYVSHLLAVASMVLEHGGDEDTAIAALLHDAAEDQGGRRVLEMITERFGSRVAELVECLSDDLPVDGQPKAPWRERKQRTVEAIARMPSEARLILAADKAHNARTILRDLRSEGSAVWERFRGGRDGSLWYYRAVVDALLCHGPEGPARELATLVDELESS